MPKIRLLNRDDCRLNLSTQETYNTSLNGLFALGLSPPPENNNYHHHRSAHIAQLLAFVFFPSRAEAFFRRCFVMVTTGLWYNWLL